MIRVIVADDYAAVRRAVVILLNRTDDIEVVGTAADGQEAVELVKDLVPDIIVMDVAMPRLSGLDATECICALDKDVRVLLISMDKDTILVQKGRENGACGYLPKEILGNSLIPAVRTVYEGKTCFFTETQQHRINNHSSR